MGRYNKRKTEPLIMNMMNSKSRNTLQIPLDIPEVTIKSIEVNEHKDYIISLESKRKSAICQYCGKEITKSHGTGREIKLRHLSVFGHRVYIRLRPKRFECPDCGGKTTTQKLSWYEANSPHTKAYDQYLILLLINSTVSDVSRKENVGYAAVEGAIERCVSTRVNWDEIEDLAIVGIDEVAMKKGKNNYLAIISSQQADGRIVLLGVLEDRKKETVRHFWESIPENLRKTMSVVCTDMWRGYVNATEEFSKAHKLSLEVVIDRYHVAKNYREAVDKLRKKETRRLKKELSKEEYEEIKGAMWTIRKNEADLEDEEKEKLNRFFEYSPELKLAYYFRENLTTIFEMNLTKEEGKEKLLIWKDNVKQSALSCFDKFLTTLDNWLDKIANYFTARLSSGFVEGLNNKLKTTKRRCYGILRVTTLFQRLYLDLEGYRHFA
jgi:transposase